MTRIITEIVFHTDEHTNNRSCRDLFFDHFHTYIKQITEHNPEPIKIQRLKSYELYVHDNTTITVAIDYPSKDNAEQRNKLFRLLSEHLKKDFAYCSGCLGHVHNIEARRLEQIEKTQFEVN